MAITEALRLVVDADTRGAVRGVENLGRTAERELSRSEKSLDKWGSRLTNVGAGLIGLGSVALVGLGKMAMMSEEANLATVKLENTLKNMPKLAGESSDQFIDLAESIQDVTAADADAIVEAQALLGTFQLTANEIKGITPLVVDYARKFGMDIPDAAIQVGKALDGQIGALKRNGVSIDEVLFKTDKYAAVQKALSQQVGGFAEAEGATFAGSVQRMKNELGDLAEGVGVGAVDAFSTLFGVVDVATTKFNELSPSAQSAIGKFATFGSVGLIAAGGVSILVGQAITMRKNFSAATDAASALITKFGGLGNAARLLAGPTALLAVGVALDQYNKAQQSMNTERLTDEFLAAGASAAAMDEVLNSLVNHGVTETIGAFEKLASTNRVAAERFVDQMEAAGADSRVIEEMRGYLRTTGEAQRQTAADTETATGAFGAEDEAIDGATSALQDYSNALAAMTDPLFAAVDAVTGNRDAQLAYSDALAGVVEAQVALDEAIAEHGPNSTEAAEATRGLEDAHRGVADAQWGTVESAAQVDSALAALKDAVDAGDVSVDTFRDTLGQWVAQGFLTQAQADEAAAAVGGLAASADVADAKRVEIPVFAPGAVPVAGQLDIVSDKVHQIPLSRNTHLSTSGAQFAIGELDAVARRVNAISGANVRVSVGGGGGLVMHDGGIVPGPRGQEVAAILQAGERVVSLDEMDATFTGPAGHSGMGGATGGGSYVDNRTIVYQVSNNDPQGTVEAIKRYERDNGPGWRN